jgi:hypothetical protein
MTVHLIIAYYHSLGKAYKIIKCTVTVTGHRNRVIFPNVHLCLINKININFVERQSNLGTFQNSQQLHEQHNFRRQSLKI